MKADYPEIERLWKGPLEELKDSLARTNLVWEISYVRSPIAIRGRTESPYSPWTFMCVDQDSYFIFGVHISHPDKSLEKGFVEFFWGNS